MLGRMGNACIIIRSVGPHQRDRSADVERVAARTVAELIAHGHAVLSGHVETGGTSIDVGILYPELPPVMDPDEPARAAYERYLHSSGGKSLASGAELPGWDALPDAIKAAWRAAADPSAPRLRR